MTTGAPVLSIVIPAYREGEAIGQVLRAIDESVTTPHEVIVVCDEADDPTMTAVSSGPFGARTRLVLNNVERGVLGAMKMGITASEGDLVLITMADGSDEYDRIDHMARLALDGAAIVAASRYMPGGHQYGGPLLKRTLSRFAGLALHHIGRVGIHDSTSNFKMYRRDFLREVRIESRAGFELALELVAKAHRSGRPIREVPTTWRDRTQGTSRFRLRKWLPHYFRWFVYALIPSRRRIQR